jgi:hypothetical protein
VLSAQCHLNALSAYLTHTTVGMQPWPLPYWHRCNY